MYLQPREAGPSGTVSSLNSPTIPTLFVDIDASTTSTSTSTSTSSTAAPSTLIHLPPGIFSCFPFPWVISTCPQSSPPTTQPNQLTQSPDPDPHHITAAVTVASTLFFIGLVAGIWYLFHARALKKRDDAEAKLSPKVREEIIARRKARAERGWWKDGVAGVLGGKFV